MRPSLKTRPRPKMGHGLAATAGGCALYKDVSHILTTLGPQFYPRFFNPFKDARGENLYPTSSFAIRTYPLDLFHSRNLPGVNGSVKNLCHVSNRSSPCNNGSIKCRP
jgi:hypothetical protein